MHDTKIASVILDDALDKPLDYAIPEHLKPLARIGMRVLVPVRGHNRKGTLIDLKAESSIPGIKPLSEFLSEKPTIPEDLFALASWMSEYYCTPFRKVIQTILPPTIRGNGKKKEQLFVKALLSQNGLVELCQTLRQKSPAQGHVIDTLLKHPKGILLSKLLEESNVSQSAVAALVKKQAISCQKMEIDRSLLIDQEYFQTKAKVLSPEQQNAFDAVVKSLEEKRFAVHLVHGVTGSGKTEIYLQAIDTALAKGKGVIFLVPEIALTSQTVERILSRFKEKVVLLHHRLSDGERFDAWREIREGNAQIAIGARSAIFSPFPDLGLIIVDEEQESSYKQEEHLPCYHARDVAVMRAKLSSGAIVLGSATPSFESYFNAKKGKYLLHTLKNRPEEAYLPSIQIVDMQDAFAKAKGFTLFSDPLLRAIEKRLATGEQTLLFLNRRGYHTAQRCMQCGKSAECPHCDLALTYHRNDNQLSCHLCDYRSTPLKVCPNCHSEEGLKFKGAGTQQVERALHAIFPNIRTLRLDADTTRHKGSHELLFKQFRSGKADLLIGTQMIAKGLHFPNVTLVGVLHGDGGLNIPDFRAAERTFQAIVQVAGRAGRAALPGEVIIQSHLPSHPAILLAKQQDFEAFFEQEMVSRKEFNYPPYCHLVKLGFSGKNGEETHYFAEKIRSLLISKLPATFEILPTVPCGHAKIKDRYRFQCLIKGPATGPISQALQNLPSPSGDIRLLIDIDPLSTYF